MSSMHALLTVTFCIGVFVVLEALRKLPRNDSF